jgi:hypothetical protein
VTVWHMYGEAFRQWLPEEPRDPQREGPPPV